MPRLDNTRHELFARAVATGKSGTEAYLLGGYKVSRSVAAAAGSRLLRNVKVAARVGELRDETDEKHEMAINGVMAELGRVAFANPIDELAFDADGDPHPKFPSGSRCKAAPITALQVEEYQGSDGSGRRPVKRVIFKSEDKLDALVKLADLLTASTLAR